MRLLIYIQMVTAVVVLATPVADAGVGCTKEFREAAISIPQALLKQGHRSFGRLDLNDFVEEAYRIKVESSDLKVIMAKNSNGRITARWENSGGNPRVLVNCIWWERFSEQKNLLAFHEYLGALGFNDTEYRISLFLWTLSLSDARKALAPKEKHNIRNAVVELAKARVGGGAVGVGGGGESATLWVRAKRISDALKLMKSAKSESQRREGYQKLAYALVANVTISYD